MPADLVRPAAPRTPAPYVPPGEYRVDPADYDYVEEEWFASGTDDDGRPYTTQVYVRRPRDRARFSGVVLVEPLHPMSVTPMYQYCSPYVMRSGHGWACVTSLQMTLDNHVKAADAEYYAALDIPGAEDAAPIPPADMAGALHFIATNQVSHAILAQCGVALRTSGPFADGDVRTMLLIGHSATGAVVTEFARAGHDRYRLDDGSPVYDGFFPAGHPVEAWGPCDVPVVQVISDGDMPDGETPRRPPVEGRQYRRPDGDDPDDRFRLYEVAGIAHMGTRYPPFDDPEMWQMTQTLGIPIAANSRPSSLPHHELLNVCLDHLVHWAANDTTPPRAARLELDDEGRFFAKDELGNTRGGVRCVQLDVPRATYFSAPVYENGKEGLGVVGTEVAFDEAKLRELYGDRATYVAQFDARLDELIRQGWFLADDADGMRQEAEAVQF